jgi:hypothetical protein
MALSKLARTGGIKNVSRDAKPDDEKDVALRAAGVPQDLDRWSSPGHGIVPPRRALHRRRAAGGAAVVALFVSLSGCGAADDIARAVKPAAEDVGILAKSKWVPPHLPPIKAAEATADEIAAEAVIIARPTEDVSSEQRKEVIDLACQAVDYEKAQNGTEADAYAYLATRVPGPYSNRQAAEALVKDLNSAQTSTERVVVLGQAALCQWASS